MDSVFLEHSVRSSLVDFLERRVQCVLRDGKILIGTLLSFDQFYNLVLGHTVKRIVVDKQFAEEPIGLFVIRGENVAHLSELVFSDLRSSFSSSFFKAFVSFS